MARLSVWVLLGLALFTVSVHDLHVRADIPTEYECRPYIEKALHDLRTESEPKTQSEEAAIDETSRQELPVDVTSQEEEDNTAAEETSIEDEPAASPEQLTPSEEAQEALFETSAGEAEATEEDVEEDENEADQATDDEDEETGSEEEEDEEGATEQGETEQADEENEEEEEEEGEDEEDATSAEEDTLDDEDEDAVSAEADENGATDEDDEEEDEDEPTDVDDQEAEADDDDEDDEEDEQVTDSQEADTAQNEEDEDEAPDSEETDLDETENDEDNDDGDDEKDKVDEDGDEAVGEEDEEKAGGEVQDMDEPQGEHEDEDASEAAAAIDASEEGQRQEDEEQTASNEAGEEGDVEESETIFAETGDTASTEEGKPMEEGSEEVVTESAEQGQEAEATLASEEGSDETVTNEESISEEAVPTSVEEVDEHAEQQQSAEDSEPLPEEDLLLEYEIPSNLRDTSHIYELLNINEEFAEKEKSLQRVADIILRDLKRIYDTAIKPLEQLYKYRDLSNRHFGDPEIFSKPLVLFMGPWSGGKSTILNYLTHNEYTSDSVRTGAEPSPAYFNILMHGDEPEVLDGTQLAADWTFSGLQKFGQGLLDRLRGQKLPNELLERVNIVEIPGILEVRKQVSQYFPFNDACQWFIDRADIIFLVYDPSKLDVGPETEAILDQLKGREYQTRILLNKADQVKPEELLRVQGALIWNISPLMSSAQPPVMYTVSLWSNPFETGAPVRLLQAQERSLLLDLGQAIDKRIENRIASARRFAVRVRNHAKMVDCYLTTYYNHKTLFANKKHISEQIIGNPQQYHIYEGLSTLTNISRYDLPDPDVYRDFFHLNPLYEFKKLSETCTYFRGCPINKLDIAIAYELPELVGKYKKLAEAALEKLEIPPLTTDFGRGKSSS